MLLVQSSALLRGQALWPSGMPERQSPRLSLAGHAVRTLHRLRSGRGRGGSSAARRSLPASARGPRLRTLQAGVGNSSLLPSLARRPCLVPQVLRLGKTEDCGFPQSHGFSSYNRATASQGKMRFIFNYSPVLKNNYKLLGNHTDSAERSPVSCTWFLQLITSCLTISSVQFSRSVVSDSATP